MNKPFEADASRKAFCARQRALRNKVLTVVAPSRWIAGLASRSPMFEGHEIDVIHTGVDTNVFRKVSSFDRSRFGIPGDATIVMFAAAQGEFEKRKGFDDAVDALLQASMKSERELHCLVVGGTPMQPEYCGRLVLHRLGFMREESDMASLYAAADLFIAPSSDDNLPNTILEAMACETPCLGYRIGGIPEMIADSNCGFLAAPNVPGALAHELVHALEVLSKSDNRTAFGKRARRHILSQFDQDHQVDRFAQVCANTKVRFDQKYNA